MIARYAQLPTKAKLWLAFKVVGIFGTLFWGFLKFVLVPSAASHALAFVQDAYEPEITVGSWSGSVLDLSATAHNLTIEINGLYDQNELLTIDELEVDLSLARRLRKGSWIQSITARSSRLYLERLLSGATNWGRLVNRQTLADVVEDATSSLQTASLEMHSSGMVTSEQEASFAVPRVKVEGLTIEWVEKIPSASGDGIIREQKATLFIDDVDVVVSDLSGFIDSRNLPSQFTLEGRMADGKVSLQARANFFAWAVRQVSAASSPNTASLRPEIVWSPSLEGSIYLENIGAATLARLVPRSALQPKQGSLSGTINFALALQNLTCSADVQLNQFTYAANSSSPTLTNRRSQVETALKTFQANGSYAFDCGNDLQDERFRPLQSFTARTTRQAVSAAPNILQATATVDEARYGQTEVDPELNELVRSLARNNPDDEFHGLSPEFLRAVDSVTKSLSKFGQFRRRLPGLRRRP